MSSDLRTLYWDQGFTLARLAKRFRCSTSTILRRMREQEIPRRSRSRANKTVKLDAKKVAAIRANKTANNVELATRYKVSRQTISQVRKGTTWR